MNWRCFFGSCKWVYSEDKKFRTCTRCGAKKSRRYSLFIPLRKKIDIDGGPEYGGHTLRGFTLYNEDKGALMKKLAEIRKNGDKPLLIGNVLAEIDTAYISVEEEYRSVPA